MRGFRTDLAMERISEESSRVEGVSIHTHRFGGIKRIYPMKYKNAGN